MTKKKPSSAKAKATKAAGTKKPADMQTRILEAALPDVAFDGWSDDLLDRAAARLGIARSVVDGAFPDGCTGLIRQFALWADDKTVAQLKPARMAALRVRDKIALGVETRLEVLMPYKAAVGAALAYMARPPRARHMPKIVWQTADALWRAAGDTSTDYNHYTKRLLLSGVLSSTMLYWLNDNSDDGEKTRAFLQKRIDNVLKIGGVIGKIKARREGGK
ncbi:MAG: COQ9 family protein [Micavibrio sp.]|nr:COQ9 family protein [Micavibrio sp.]